MSINLISYPVETESGNFLNCFVGFKPIELEFQATAAEIGVECVLIDYTTSADLLGFSLYADFDTNGLTVIDVSIVNDQGGQAPVLESQQITDSRIKYRVKYREAGTSGSYTIISAPEEPLIAVYNIADFNLDEWLTPITDPSIWLGYPVMAGFIHSDSNEVGLDIYVRYDTLDIQKNVLVADSILHLYGSGVYGALTAQLSIESVVPEVFYIENGGAGTATDWINPDVNNVAEYWSAIFALFTAAIVTGNGFTGNAQRVNVSGTPGPDSVKFVSDTAITLNASKEYKIRFKYRCDASIQVYLNSTTTASIPANTGNAILVERDLTLGLTSYIPSIRTGNASWMEIDEVEILETTATPSLDGVEYITYKIVSE